MQFPYEGRFKLKDDVLYTHYILCGDSETCESASSVTKLSSSQPGLSKPSLRDSLLALQIA